MSIQLQPQKNFAIVRQLPDPSDSATYYVQAVIRNAETDALIDTVNLSDKGQRRFIAVWRVISDKSGQGTLISIRTTVYTDSGHTAESTTYSQEMETYLIMERFNPNEIVRLLGPALGGDGVKVDYKKIKELISEVVDKKVVPILQILEDLESNQGDEQNIINSIKSSINSATKDIKNELPEAPEEVDLSPIISIIKSGFENIKSSIATLYDYEKNKEDVDFSPVIDAIKEFENNQQGSNNSIANLEQVFMDFSNATKNQLPEISQMIDSLHEKVRQVILSTMALMNKNIEAGPTPKKEDHLARAKQLIGAK